MLFRETDFPLDAEFNEPLFENIFLHNAYPGDKSAKAGKKAQPAHFADKAEIWALFDAKPQYNGLNMVRRLRQLWGIHLTLRIGARSKTNSSSRGVCALNEPKKKPRSVYFEGYQGNISDAARGIVTIAPYGHAEKSRALSQKFFIRLIVPLKGQGPIEKIESLLMAYSIVLLMDPRRFAGIVDPDMFLFVPPASVRAGLASYHGGDSLLNTHLVSGFNFYDSEGKTRYFTHGLNRFGMADLLLSEAHKDQPLTSADYTTALKKAHTLFLQYLTTGGKKQPAGKTIPKSEKIPEQVAAMTGKKMITLTV
jgi:hypothetical protein